MDTTMNDVAANGSFSDSDDWGTPGESRSGADLGSDNDFNFADLGRKLVFDKDNAGSRKGSSKPKKKAVRFSHPPAGSEQGDDVDLSPLTPPPARNNITPRHRNNSPGLFVSEDEDQDTADNPLVVKGDTQLNRPSNILRKILTNKMDGLTRARAIKAKIENNISVLQPFDKMNLTRPSADDDAEDQIIKTLRSEQNMGWADIANFLNQERLNRGEAGQLTASSIYSRFVRSAPKIAVPVNELGFDPKDYRHLRHPNEYSTNKGTGTISKAGKKRVKNYDNAKELESNMRKLVSEDEYGDLETGEKTDQLMDAVAKVERNFWTLVADEMERTTTKLYPAGRLADRYHEI